MNENRPLRLSGRTLGLGKPCFVIAEAGVNHDGDVEKARRLVDVAADAGADAVKFQTFDPASLVSDEAPKAEYQKRAAGDDGRSTQRAMLEALVLPRAAHEELKERAEARGLFFLSTPFEEASADFLADELRLPALKVPSGELTNHPFLEHLARKGLPLLVSTGMADLAEVEAAVRAIRAAGDPPLALLHCVSCYPADPRLCNLRAMRTLADRFHVPVGFSDHTLGVEVALAAAALGASLVEKHFTLDSKAAGPDHAASLEPADLRRMVAGIRAIESALGSGVKAPAPEEAAVAAVARKSLHWRGALPAGAAIAREHLAALRPGTGVPPSELAAILGRRTLRAVRAGALAARSDWEAAPAGARA